MGRLRLHFHPQCGPVAQLGERKHGMFQVAGSIPVRSTIFPTEKCYKNSRIREFKNSRIQV